MAIWIEHESPNPFLRYRELLWSYDMAIRRGWSDAGFVELVAGLDERLVELEGRGFILTPFSEQPRLADAIGFEGALWIKDETANVAGSHKARHLFGLALHLAIQDDAVTAGRLAISSCGNAALGAATVAAAAGRPIDVFIPTWADPVVVAELAERGAELHVCERRRGESGDPCMHRFREAVDAGSQPFGVQATESPMTLDGGRTIGFEMVSQGPAPDRVFVQVGGGALATCVGLAYVEAVQRGRLVKAPALHPVQTEGCAPFNRAWSLLAPRLEDDPQAAFEHARTHPEEFMWPWASEPASVASGILDDVTYDWIPLAEVAAGSGGEPVVVPEPLIVETQGLVRQLTEVPVDATGTAGLAGFVHWLELAESPPATAAVLFTGRDRSVD